MVKIIRQKRIEPLPPYFESPQQTDVDPFSRFEHPHA